MKKILIVHYNTPFATECLIKSINKHVKETYIYVFDNSDKDKFVNTFENVYVFDNTNYDIINFDEIIKQYHPEYTHKTDSTYASFKHCISVQKAIELIDDNFVLIDSDVLIKKDFSFMYEDNKICVGTKQIWGDRICPILQYINVKMCKEHNISYYNDYIIIGSKENKNKIYDTGTYFTEQITNKNLPILNINIMKYIFHYSGASRGLKHKISLEDWLIKHKDLWE
jgi:hypothetical protein